MDFPRSGLGRYLRRRWRIVGFFVVLMAGTALFAVLADRGHEPMWEARLDDVETVAAAPDASRIYALTKANGTMRDLVAYDRAGREAWRVVVPGSPPDAVVEATDGAVALATTASRAGPGAHLLVLDSATGGELLRESLPHTARALGFGPGLLAVALEVPGSMWPVHVWRNLVRAETFAWNESVETLDAEAGLLAIGSAKGRIVVVDPSGALLVNVTRAYTVYQVRLDQTGSFLVAVGKEFAGPGGRIEYYRLRDAVPDLPRWENRTASEVRYLDVSRDGSRALALASPPGSASQLLFFDTARGGPPVWSLDAPGIIHRQGTSTAAAARVSPDGGRVAFGTLTGSIALYDTTAGPRLLWTHEATGTTSVAFPANRTGLFVADASYSAPKGFDRVLFFDAEAEPLLHDLSRFVPAAVAVEAILGGIVLGIGWNRRPSRM